MNWKLGRTKVDRKKLTIRTKIKKRHASRVISRILIDLLYSLTSAKIGNDIIIIPVEHFLNSERNSHG